MCSNDLRCELICPLPIPTYALSIKASKLIITLNWENKGDGIMWTTQKDK